MDLQTNREGGNCLACGEPLESGWKICPACEAPVGQPVCPSCARTVKGNWKVCPECGVRLICRGCGGRLPAGGAPCPVCAIGGAPAPAAPGDLIEPVTGMEFVCVPGGVYPRGDLFGNGWENELPVREVRVADFHIGRYPVTQGQWRRVMPENPSRFQKGDDYPVEQVSWFDTAEFIRRLNSMTTAGRVLDLPSEEQWEYAARSGGLKQLYSGGDDIEVVAWYSENSEGSTHPVGRKTPNGLGLYDMSGNVWEWCRDLYTPGASRDRVIRGGSWNLDAWSARCSRRFGFSADYSGAGLGFRLAARLG
ncbi:MAG: SUMF1/EgtB/PvdO family nonheme iron enzyme [Desulfobacterales bacterium]